MRHQGGQVRYYVDLRDLGGEREALIPPGAARATDNPEIGEALAADRVRELQRRRPDKVILGYEPTTLSEFAEHHLRDKARASKVTDKHLERAELCLRRAVDYFGARTDLELVAPHSTQKGLTRGHRVVH